MAKSEECRRKRAAEWVPGGGEERRRVEDRWLVVAVELAHHALHDLAVHSGTDIRTIADHDSKSLNQLLLGIGLQQVARGPCAKGPAQQFRRLVKRQQNDFDVR